MDRARADYMGMLGTVMNCLALQDFLREGTASRPGCRPPSRWARSPSRTSRGARSGTSRRAASSSSARASGLPYFSTDTTAAQRALEIGAEVVLMAKGVDGVYDADPRTNPDADALRPSSRHREVLDRGLKVADATAFSLCMDNDLPIVVFNLLVEGNIARAVRGEKIGTLVVSSQTDADPQPAHEAHE